MDKLLELVNELTGGDDEQAEAAARGLSGHGGQALEALTPLLADPDPDRRWWAARALAEVQHAQAAELLIQALGDPDGGVRGCAARGLQERPDERAVPALADTLNDHDSLVARLAGNALAAAGAMAVPTLVDILQSGAFQSQCEAARALALIGDQRSIPALFGALESESPLIEYWANEGLERMGVGMTFFIP